jgi:hypothetical protein
MAVSDMKPMAVSDMKPMAVSGMLQQVVNDKPQRVVDMQRLVCMQRLGLKREHRSWIPSCICK